MAGHSGDRPADLETLRATPARPHQILIQGNLYAMARRMGDDEIEHLLGTATIAHLATIDTDGYPHVTPLWFLWDDGVFYLASDAGRPHLLRIEANPKVGLVIDMEEEERPDGERPNRQVRIVGDAVLRTDPHGEWTERIWAKYLRFRTELDTKEHLRGRSRVVTAIRPLRLTAVASV